MINYGRNPESALNADIINTIDTGKYIGIIISADVIRSRKSEAKGVVIRIEEQFTGYIIRLEPLWYIDKQGNLVSFVMNKLYALAELIDEELIVDEKDDGDEEFVTLLSKKIGVVIEKLPNTYSKYKYRYNLLHFYHPETEQLYNEFANGLQPKRLKQIMKSLESKKEIKSSQLKQDDNTPPF